MKVIKIGGKLIENQATLERVVDALVGLGNEPFVLVHGGGTLATQLAKELGVEQRMHEGRRITDARTLELAVMAYAGLANKRVVAALSSLGKRACGLSGCDMGVVVSHRRPVGEIDWGFVGDVDSVDAEVLSDLLDKGICPVLSPITCSAEGELLNTNADSVAAAVAIAMAGRAEVEAVMCLDKPGVLLDVDDPESVIPKIDRALYEQLKSEGKIFSGMIPKLDNAFSMIASGVEAVRITDADHLDSGTLIVK